MRLGPTVNGNTENFLEHAINTLNHFSKELSQNPSKEELKAAIRDCKNELKKDKTRLADYVPYKLLYPFFDTEEMEEGLSYIKNDKHRRLIAYMGKLTGNENILYTIIDGVGLQKRIRLNFFKERGIKFQFIDMKEKGMSKGEFNSVAQANGGLENMINWEGKDKDLLAFIKYIAEEDKLEKVLENPQVIKTPVIRNGKQSTLGYQPDSVEIRNRRRCSGNSLLQPDIIFCSTISVIIKISPSFQKRMTEIFRPVYSCSNQSAIS